MEYESFIIFLKSLGKLSKMDESLIRRSFNPYIYRKNKVIHKFQFADYKLIFITKGLGRVYRIEENQKLTTTAFGLSEQLLIIMQTIGEEVEYFEALEDTEFLAIPGKNLKRMLGESLMLKDIYCLLLEDQILMHSIKFQAFNSADVCERLFYLKNTYPQIIGRVSDNVLSSFLCIFRETLVRYKPVLLAM